MEAYCADIDKCNIREE